MQSLLVLALLIFVTSFTVMEAERINVTSNDTATNHADLLAENLLQYNNLLVHYALVNYDDILHLFRATTPGKVEGVNLIDNIKLNQYSQINFTAFLNYQSVAFNYSVASEDDPTPILYLAISFDNVNFKALADINLPEMLGGLNQRLSKSLYQGNSTYWVVPLLVKQDNCSIREVYSQIPKDVNDDSQLNRVNPMFSKFCTQLRDNYSYNFLSYVLLEPMFKNAV